MKTIYMAMYVVRYIQLMWMKIKAWWRCEYCWDSNMPLLSHQFVYFIEENGYLVPRHVVIIYRYYSFPGGWKWHMPYIYVRNGKIPAQVIRKFKLIGVRHESERIDR
jgi:hypothetical protein